MLSHFHGFDTTGRETRHAGRRRRRAEGPSLTSPYETKMHPSGEGADFCDSPSGVRQPVAAALPGPRWVVSDAGAVTKRPHTDWSAKELAHLSDEQLAQRHREAAAAEARADAPGMGRSVKGRRLWRGNRELVEEEIARRATAAGETPVERR